ncbi:zinc finger and BTB domain-containing protein 7B [Nerophis ophidion]|uniref:zinc finger and BTB domain-containing protein 7B n=1 Tax=Nerophis ophidion TaxID=159077 RepID=UPI002AE03A85|nr:zinc finger and BTB domain-containing protein 7B [Nerophis ophidion]XP_061771206.1 zinc finger and BTB domain-containing protein 7B [Nerophis ophidion]XP_061771207.1 zinc finger and BTB domain-containing protein 7B [Nerophis ophidion]XP_061771208.1 zinc finger and BTB domain-containing protein 7B [Nerophis ophidion]XP_061771209.1 zinc finger and BTB domain-containing protein 7B [Nerophis ophidion]
MSPGEDGLIGIPFPEHSSEILSHLNDQRRTGLLCDLTLTSRGARYPTHRSVMAAVSLYFRRLFGAEEGGSGGGFSVCQLDCVAPDALDALLEFAYTATLTIPSSGMRDVLRGARLLGIQCVADACSDILGEKLEPAEEEEQRNRSMAAPRRPGAEPRGDPRSRRKKVKKVGTYNVTPPGASPVPHPLPVPHPSENQPPTRPPSPQPEEHLFRWRQDKDPGALRGPERTATLNGGHPPHVPPSEDKPSGDVDTDGFGNESALAESVSAVTSMAGGGGAAMAGGRKRKSQTPQQCPVCQKIIHGAGKLPRHMRTHTGEKPFQCSACGVRFTRKDKLKIHMRKHTGERPYSCPHCSARFLHSYDLKNHLCLHSGGRPFECPLCHKAFARDDHLQRHRKGLSCLEMRPRRPRRGPDHQERGEVEVEVEAEAEVEADGGTPPAHSSLFLPPAAVFRHDADTERALALQALAQLSPHRFANYRGLILQRGGGEVAGPGDGGQGGLVRLEEQD